jgi:hypothetical protein
MIAFAGMLLGAAKEAGMKIPKHPDDDFDRKKFPHFHCFCLLQLGRPCVTPGEHFGNAKIIAKIPEKKLVKMTLEDFIRAGVRYSS